MKKKLIIGGLLFLSLFLRKNSVAYAAADNNDESIPICGITMSGVTLAPNIDNPDVKPTSQSEDGKTTYFPFKACVTDPGSITQLNSCMQTGSTVKLSGNTGPISWTSFPLTKSGNCFTATLELKAGHAYDFNKLDVETEGGSCPKNTPICRRVSANIDRSSTIEDEPKCQAARDNFCNGLSISPDEIVIDQELTFNFNIDPLLDDFQTCSTEYDFHYTIIPPKGGSSQNSTLDTGPNTFTYTPTILTTHQLVITASKYYNGYPVDETIQCRRNFVVGTTENPGAIDEEPDPLDEDAPFEICKQIPETNADGSINDKREKCMSCFEGEPSGVWTAIGCIKTDTTQNIIGKLMTVGISIAGGIALLMILAAAFMFSTSEGEPKRTGEAKEILTQAIIGLVFIIFSITILEFIGVNILRIPGFGE